MARRPGGARTAAHILDCAVPLFAARGFSGTSIRMVAGEAGVNVATLAYHFDDKQGLYDAVVQRLHADLAAGLGSMRLPLDADDLVAVLVGEAWAFVKDHREHIRLLMRHVLDSGGHPDVVMARWVDGLMAQADTIVAGFRPDWSLAQRRMLVVGVQHLMARLAVENPDQLAVMLGHPADLDTEIERWFAGMVRRELGLPAP